MKLLALLLAIVLLSCSSRNGLITPVEMVEEEEIPIDPRDVIPAETCVLDDATSSKRLFEIQSYEEDGSVKFRYLRYEQGRLITYAADSPRIYEQYKYDEQDRLILILSGSRSDSLFYDEMGRMSKRTIYDENGTPQFNYRYSYDPEGQMIAIVSEFMSSQYLGETDSLTLEDGNIIREEYYRGDLLLYEHCYTYDSSPNYRKHNHYWIDWPWMYFSRNNTLTRSTIEYGVQFNFYCFDCEWFYEYDFEGYPVYITDTYTASLQGLSYDCD